MVRCFFLPLSTCLFDVSSSAVLAEIGSPQDPIVSGEPATAQSSTELNQNASASGRARSGRFRQIMRLKALHIMAVFILIYVGVEVTIGSE